MLVESLDSFENNRQVFVREVDADSCEEVYQSAIFAIRFVLIKVLQVDLVMPDRFGDISCLLVVDSVVERVNTFLVFRNDV